MNIKKIYDLEDVTTDESKYEFPKWCDHDAFFEFVGHDPNVGNFNYKDAYSDERVKIHLKATAEVGTKNLLLLEYIAVSFDGMYVGLIVCVNYGRDDDCYITDYPMYQALVAYIKTMYSLTPENIADETAEIKDLDGRYGFVIDKRYKNNLRKEKGQWK